MQIRPLSCSQDALFSNNILLKKYFINQYLNLKVQIHFFMPINIYISTLKFIIKES